MKHLFKIVKNKKIKKMLTGAGLLFFLTLATIFTVNYLVSNQAKPKLYTAVETIPSNKVGLLLGTRKYLESGRENLYYRYRIEAASTLFKAGKIEYLLVSGDNSRKSYDEPTDMMNDLVLAGIPEEKIFLDYAGFRTLDSVVRCRDVFGENKITVISQAFHNERALFIAAQKGIDAIGFNAKDVGARYGFKVQQREKLARVKMVLDLLIGKQPKFLGKQIEIS